MKHEATGKTPEIAVFNLARKIYAKVRPGLPPIPDFSNLHWRKASLGAYMGRMIQVQDDGAYFWGTNEDGRGILEFLPPDAITSL